MPTGKTSAAASSETGREGFRIAMEVSAYSLLPLVRRAAPLMTGGGSVVAMTFDASQRVYPGYNVMGTAKAALENSVRQLASEFGPDNIRVNAISAGPLETLAARGISGFREMRHIHAERAPLQRNITADEVANTALFSAALFPAVSPGPSSRWTPATTLWPSELPPGEGSRKKMTAVWRSFLVVARGRVSSPDWTSRATRATKSRPTRAISGGRRRRPRPCLASNRLRRGVPRLLESWGPRRWLW